MSSQEIVLLLVGAGIALTGTGLTLLLVEVARSLARKRPEAPAPSRPPAPAHDTAPAHRTGGEPVSGAQLPAVGSHRVPVQAPGYAAASPALAAAPRIARASEPQPPWPIASDKPSSGERRHRIMLAIGTDELDMEIDDIAIRALTAAERPVAKHRNDREPWERPASWAELTDRVERNSLLGARPRTSRKPTRH